MSFMRIKLLLKSENKSKVLLEKKRKCWQIFLCMCLYFGLNTSFINNPVHHHQLYDFLVETNETFWGLKFWMWAALIIFCWSRWWNEWKADEGKAESPPACLFSSRLGGADGKCGLNAERLTTPTERSTTLTDVPDEQFPNSFWPLAALSAHIQAA